MRVACSPFTVMPGFMPGTHVLMVVPHYIVDGTGTRPLPSFDAYNAQIRYTRLAMTSPAMTN